MQTEPRDQVVVVLVEDDEDLAEVTQAALQHEGLRVVVAHDGREGLDLIEKVHPQVVVTDLIMPVLDGRELIRRLAAAPAPRAPVIAVSAVGARLRVARELGAAEVLLKPVAPEELLESVRRAAAART